MFIKNSLKVAEFVPKESLRELFESSLYYHDLNFKLQRIV